MGVSLPRKGGGSRGIMSLTMVIGILRLTLHIPNSGSLKAKRQVVSGLLRRVRSQFQVAAAEIGDRERWQLAELGIACESAEGSHADEVVARVLRFVEQAAGEAQVADVATELIRL